MKSSEHREVTSIPVRVTKNEGTLAECPFVFAYLYGREHTSKERAKRVLFELAAGEFGVLIPIARRAISVGELAFRYRPIGMPESTAGIRYIRRTLDVSISIAFCTCASSRPYPYGSVMMTRWRSSPQPQRMSSRITKLSTSAR